METKHSFKPSQLNPVLCAVCYQLADVHTFAQLAPEKVETEITECEACNKSGKLTKIGKMWLCDGCIEDELTNKPTPKSIEIPEQTVDSLATEINSDHKPTEIQNSAINRLGSQSITSSNDYFNARTMAISDRWAEIIADDSINQENKHYQLAKEVREHFIHLKNVLFQAVEIQLECTAGQRADQVYLNTLASKLREEERIKLHLQNIDYVPPVVPVSKPKGIRVSKDDKVAEGYARIMNIPIETARRLIANKLKEVTGATCSCQETPGLCRIHSK